MTNRQFRLPSVPGHIRTFVPAARGANGIFFPDPGAGFACFGEELIYRFLTSPKAMSFRECYERITGDERMTGRLANCNQMRMREALDTGSWTEVFGSAVRRAMVAEYRRGDRWNVWRKLVKIGDSVPDFRNQQRVRFGGYGDLPTVNEGSSYQALQSPADESASFSLQKHGGTEVFTLEMVKNDDIQAIRRIPKRLAEAALRTIAHFVLDFLRTNPVIYDGVALFHATRNNLDSAALSAAALNAARAAMMRQTEPDSGDPIGAQPARLAVPFELEETAVNLFRRGENQDRSFVQSLPIEVLPIWYWTDTNDWCVVADPAVLPCIEIGFLDGNDEPELFVQDQPSVGSLFANDQITVKIRHIYGGAVIDYRGLYKSAP